MKTKKQSFFIFGFGFIFIFPFLSFGQALPTIPYDELEVGSYTNRGTHHVSNIKIRKWAEEHYLVGSIRYGNTYAIEALLMQTTKPQGKRNFFSGEGTIKQGWQGGTVCEYKIKLELWMYQEQDTGKKLFYLREYVPSRLYERWDIDGRGCPPAAGPYTWNREENPYYLKSSLSSLRF